MMLAYVGPESVTAIGSGIAAFLGFLLMFWRRIVSRCKRIWRFITRSGPPADASTNEDQARQQAQEPAQLQEERG